MTDTSANSSVPSVIPMANGSRAIRAEITGLRGTVLAEWRGGEYVTWRVERLPTDTEWHAFHGHYFQTYLAAERDFQTRVLGF